MDVSTTLIVVLMFLCCNEVVCQQSSEGRNNTADNTGAPSTPKTPTSCTTAHGGLAGLCVKRTYCDYGTPAIDFTLFLPRGFKSSCTDEEVCCPPDSMIPTGNGDESPNTVVDG